MAVDSIKNRTLWFLMPIGLTGSGRMEEHQNFENSSDEKAQLPILLKLNKSYAMRNRVLENYEYISSSDERMRYNPPENFL